MLELEFNADGSIKRLKSTTPLVNTITGARYVAQDLRLLEEDGKKYLHPKHTIKTHHINGIIKLKIHLKIQIL